MVPIKQIKPYERNARKNDKTVEKLVELLPKVGFNVPLLIDNFHRRTPFYGRRSNGIYSMSLGSSRAISGLSRKSIPASNLLMPV